MPSGVTQRNPAGSIDHLASGTKMSHRPQLHRHSIFCRRRMWRGGERRKRRRRCLSPMAQDRVLFRDELRDLEVGRIVPSHVDLPSGGRNARVGAQGEQVGSKLSQQSVGVAVSAPRSRALSASHRARRHVLIDMQGHATSPARAVRARRRRIAAPASQADEVESAGLRQPAAASPCGRLRESIITESLRPFTQADAKPSR